MKISERIKDSITIQEVLTKYGYQTNNRRSIPCMIHGGKRNNFGYNDNVFHCWSCGARGDVIGLVKQMFDLEFRQAAIKINNDFNLYLTDERPTLRQIAAARNQVKDRKREHLERIKLKEEYIEQVNIYQYLQKFIYKYGPTDPDQPSEEWNSVFVYAAQNIGIIENWLDENISRMEVRN